MSEGKIVATLKAGPGYEVPWVVIHADNPQEAVDLVGWVSSSGFLTQVASAGREFRSEYEANKALGTTPVQSPAAQYQTAQAPAAPEYAAAPAATPPWPTAAPQVTSVAMNQPDAGAAAPSCMHGQKKFVSGNGAKGPYKFWGCPARKGDPTQCKPEWIND